MFAEIVTALVLFIIFIIVPLVGGYILFDTTASSEYVDIIEPLVTVRVQSVDSNGIRSKYEDCDYHGPIVPKVYLNEGFFDDQVTITHPHYPERIVDSFWHSNLDYKLIYRLKIRTEDDKEMIVMCGVHGDDEALWNKLKNREGSRVYLSRVKKAITKVSE